MTNPNLRNLRSVAWLAASLGAAFSLVFVYYFWFYVPFHVRYFTDHSFRDLAVAGDRIGAAVDAYANATRNAAISKNLIGSDAGPPNLLAALDLAAPLKYVPTAPTADGTRIQDVDRRGCGLDSQPAAAVAEKPAAGAPKAPVAEPPTASPVDTPALTLSVRVSGPETVQASSAIENRRAVLEGRVHRTSATLYFRYRCNAKDEPDKSSYCHALPTQQVCTKIALDDLLDPIVSGGTFDTLDPIVIGADGAVIYQQSGSGIRIDQMSASGPPKTTKNASGSGDAPPADGLPSIEEMRRSTFATNLELSQAKYRIYSQPVRLTIPLAGSDQDAPWVVAGLVTTENVYRATHDIPIRFVYLLPTLVLVGLLGWPAVKLWAIGSRERLRAFDVLYLGLSTVVSSGLVTIALLDAYAYGGLQSAVDGSMQAFADELRSDFRKELRCASWALDQYAQSSAASDSPSNQNCDPLQVQIFAAQSTSCWGDIKEKLRSSYPFLDMVVRADTRGKQQEKWTVKNAPTPLISMEPFESFQNPRNDWLATVQFSRPEDSSKLECGKASDARLSLAVLVSPNTGETLPTVSKRNKDSDGSVGVVAMIPEFVSLRDPITPPGIGFAVVQESGKVLFHSNRFRNLYENFFAEVSDPAALQALAGSRRAGFVTGDYHGRPHRMFVAPIADVPWTLIVFRDKELLSTLNLQIVGSAVLTFLLLVAATSLCMTVLRFQWPDAARVWFWPDARREPAYARATVELLAFAGWFVWAIAAFRAPAVAKTLLLAPTAAASFAYLVLGYGHPAANRRSWLALFVWIAAGLGLLWVSALEALASPVNAIALLWLLALPFAAMTWPRKGNGGPFRFVRGGAFVSFSLVLLFVLTVLPSAALFADSFAQGMDSWTRYNQLALGSAFARRVENAYRRYAANDRLLFEDRLKSDWDVPQPAAPLMLGRLACGDPAVQSQIGSRCKPDDPNPSPSDDLREGFARHFTFPMMANLWEYSLAGRQLTGTLYPRSNDCSWQTFAADSSRSVLRLWDDRFAHDAPATCAGVWIAARVPKGLLPESRRGAAALLSAVLVLVAAAFWVVRILVNRIFGLEADDLPSIGTAVERASGSFFLRPRGAVSRQLEDLAASAYTVDIARAPESLSWDQEVSQAASRPIVLVTHLEHRIEDPKWNSAKLNLLERLVLKEERPVALVSEVDPLGYFARRLRSLSDPANETNYVTAEELHRWARVLVRLRKVRSDLVLGGSADRNELGRMLHDECRWTERLRGIEIEIREEGNWTEMTREGLSRHINDLAEAHYRSLWALCTDEERLVLVHLATEGFINPNTWRIVRRLLRRGLITRGAGIRVMNETFAHFVADVEPDKVATLEQAEGASLWQTMRSTGVILGIAGALFLFFTQREAVNSWLGLFPAMAGAAAAIAQIFGLFQRKTGQPNSNSP